MQEFIRRQTAMKKVIVLGESYPALGVVKGLAKEGVFVILMFTDPNDITSHSRFVSQRIRIPSPMTDSDGLLGVLMDPKETWDGALLIPTRDEYVVFVSQNSAELRKRFVFTTQDWDITKRIINKNYLYPQAQAAGILTPQVFFPDSVQFITEKRNEFTYPCILKPFESHKFYQIYKRKMLMIHNFEELVEKFIDTQKHKLAVMISEIIPGDDSSFSHYRSYIDSQGEVLAEICTQKLRQYPSGFGVAAVAKTIPIIEELRQQVLKLLGSLSYRGESSAEFKLDPRDNQFKLMEINVRPTVPELHFVAAGINFPYITYLDLVENKRIPSLNYLKELYWIHNYYETVNFVKLLGSGNLNMREFFKPYWKKKVFEISFLDDPINYLISTYFIGIKALGRAQKEGI
jgi:D-aspartate ligase